MWWEGEDCISTRTLYNQPLNKKIRTRASARWNFTEFFNHKGVSRVLSLNLTDQLGDVHNSAQYSNSELVVYAMLLYFFKSSISLCFRRSLLSLQLTQTHTKSKESINVFLRYPKNKHILQWNRVCFFSQVDLYLRNQSSFFSATCFFICDCGWGAGYCESYFH